MEFLSQIILAKVPVREVVKRYSSDFNGNSALTRCINPAHNDSSPSMKIYDDSNTVYCFGCGFSGNPISIVSKIEKISLVAAMYKLKEWFGIEEDLTQLSLKERSDFSRQKAEFHKTWDFYFKMFKRQNVRLTNEILQELEDCYQLEDVHTLKKIYTEIKDGKRQLL